MPNVIRDMDYSQASDWELVRLSNDDPRHFRYLVDRYQDRIFRYLKRMSYYGPEDIEDMVQEIFIKVYRNSNDFESTDKFSSLIYRIAHNHLVDCIRKSTCRYSSYSLDDNDAVNLIKANTDIESEVAEKDAVERIKKAISSLPVKYREVLILKFLEEKKIEEIVDILRKPQGTVATLLRRGRDLLKKNLKQSGIKPNS